MTLTRPHTRPSPVSSSQAWGRVRPSLLLGGSVLALSLALHVRDPHASGSWGFCPWLSMTGTYCPGCGGLRAVNDLTHGDLVAAASSNLLLVTTMPMLAGLWGRDVYHRWRGAPRPVPSWVIRFALPLLGVLALVFWVARNLPAGTWLAP